MEQTIQIKILRKKSFHALLFQSAISLFMCSQCKLSTWDEISKKMEVYHSQILSNFSLLNNVQILYFVGFFFFECRGHLCQYCSCRVTSHHSECPENTRSILRLLQSLIIIVTRGMIQINTKAIQFECLPVHLYVQLSEEKVSWISHNKTSLPLAASSIAHINIWSNLRSLEVPILLQGGILHGSL